MKKQQIGIFIVLISFLSVLYFVILFVEYEFGLTNYLGKMRGNEAMRSIDFEDVTQESGLNYIQNELVIARSHDYFSGGVAVGDYNNDDWPDLYVTRLDKPGILFKNLKDGTFKDVTEGSGLEQNFHSNGAAWGDIDNDGDLDLYVTTLNHTRYYLYINDGEGYFTEEGIKRGAVVEGEYLYRGFSVTFGDYDNDGYLDIHTTDWSKTKASRPYSYARLLHNLGEERPGFFEDVTEQAGVITNHSFSSRFSDLDRDGNPDLVVVADFGASKLFWNNGNGTFTDGTKSAGFGIEENGMGLTVQDYDNDGLLDIFVTSISNKDCKPNCTWPPKNRSGNRLYKNEGNRIFSDQTDSAGVRHGDWGWAAKFFDYDNDGDLDLMMTNSHRLKIEPMRLWRNDNNKFTDIAVESGLANTKLNRGLAVFDYDKDGDLDIFIVNTGDHPILYRNNIGNKNNFLRVKAIGKRTNANGYGVIVKITPQSGESSQIIEIDGGNNFLGQSEPITHFGLGKLENSVDLVTIYWTDDTTQTFKDVPVNTVLVARQE